MHSRRVLLALALAAPVLPVLRAVAAPARPAARGEIPICRGGFVQRTTSIAPRGASEEADFLEKLGLMEGHLMIGRRLMEGNETRLAIPHFGHPVRELYGWLEPRIAIDGIAQFERELDAMERLAARGVAGTGGAFAEAWNVAMPRLRAAQNAVPAALRNSPRFMMEHVAMMIHDVSADYGESIERGRIVNIVEYHDSAGFLAYAAQVTADERAKPGAARPAWTEIAAAVEEIRARVYPELLPPSRLPASISWVRARSETIRGVANRMPA